MVPPKVEGSSAGERGGVCNTVGGALVQGFHGD
jgi:hypothetical protein